MLLLICVLIVIFSNITLGFFVYFNNPKKNANKSFALMCISISAWTVFNYLADYQLSKSLLWTRMSFFAISFALGFLLIFLNNFPNKIINSKIYRHIIYFVSSSIALVTLLPNFIPSVSIIQNGSNVETGILYPSFIVYFVLAFALMIFLFFRSWKKSKGQDKLKLRFLVLGIVIMSVLASITNLFLPLITGSNDYAKFGTLFTLIFVGLTAYAMVRHSLFNIRLVVARSFTYILSILFIGSAYGFLAFGIAGRYVFPESESYIKLNQQIFNTALAIVLAFTFQPIRKFFEKFSNAIFYRDKYDPQQLINQISAILAEEIRISHLSKRVTENIKRNIKIEHADIVVFDGKDIVYSTNNMASRQHESDLGQLSKITKSAIFIEDYSDTKNSSPLYANGYFASLPLKTSEEFLGFLLLGEKRSGEVYTEEDKKTLKIIAKELSIGIQNSRAFSEINNFNLTLQQKIDTATSNLRKANSQLKELDEAKDEFISMASHQLRTPLTTVKGYVSMLNEGDFGNLNKEQKESVGLALDGSNRMARLIDDLLNISRMEAGKFYIDASLVDLSKIIKEEVALLGTLAKSKKVSVKFTDFEDNIPAINLDETKTRQVIMNLVDNAIHYSDPSGGGKIEISLRRAGESVEFIVKDNGIGVPKDQQSRLFTKMFRAKNAKEVRPDGTGLGLYLVKRVIEDQGGKIIFLSESGKGSIFGFSMPIHNIIKIDKKAKAKLLKNRT